MIYVKLKIYLNEKIKKPMEFIIILTYPEEAGLKCKLNDNQNEIF